jgi:hypothetical protein
LGPDAASALTPVAGIPNDAAATAPQQRPARRLSLRPSQPHAPTRTPRATGTEATMSEESHGWQMLEYEGFEIHLSPRPKQSGESRFTHIGYVCHLGADPAIPGHVMPFHADGEEWFASMEEARYEAVHTGRSIVDGTHPDLSVLSLVTGGV